MSTLARMGEAPLGVSLERLPLSGHGGLDMVEPWELIPKTAVRVANVESVVFEEAVDLAQNGPHELADSRLAWRPQTTGVTTAANQRAFESIYGLSG